MSQWPTLDDMHFPAIEQSMNYAASSLALVNNNYPDFTTIIASTAQDTQSLYLACHYNTGQTAYEIDIAIGAVSGEQIICEKIIFDGNGTNPRTTTAYILPVTVPAGTRLSYRARQAGVATYGDTYMQYLLMGSSGMGSAGYSRCEYIGVATVDAGAVAHTKGVYAELIASAANDYKAIMTSPYRTTVFNADIDYLYDLAVGAASSEQIILPDQYVREADSCNVFLEHSGLVLPLHIPAGTRLSARVQSSTTSTSYRVIKIPLWGFR